MKEEIKNFLAGKKPTCSISEIEKAFSYAHSDIVNILKILEAEGLIKNMDADGAKPYMGFQVFY